MPIGICECGRDRSDFRELCSSCHKLFDIRRNKEMGGNSSADK